MSQMRRRLYEQSAAAVEAWLQEPNRCVTSDMLEHIELLRWLLERDLAANPGGLVAAVRAVLSREPVESHPGEKQGQQDA